jgi:hercynylcysteine S-oxide lyase
MTYELEFGRAFRKNHFSFSPSFTPVNHGSFGATPTAIEEKHYAMQRHVSERPDVFIIHELPALIDESRRAVAPLLGVDPDEVVFLPNTMTGVNTVLRNLIFEEGDILLHFSTIYDACENTILSIGEYSPLRPVAIPITYPIEDHGIVQKFRDAILKQRSEGMKVKIAIFDTVSSFPGVRVPWEDLVDVCKELGVLSLVDGAHGIGLIDLTHLGSVSPDFFISNCHKYKTISPLYLYFAVCY